LARTAPPMERNARHYNIAAWPRTISTLEDLNYPTRALTGLPVPKEHSENVTEGMTTACQY
jgi:hypothetical protein